MNGCDGLFTEALDGTGVDREQAGDKAWALERLIEHGFPVPAAILVRAAAYRAAVSAPELRRLLGTRRSTSAPGGDESPLEDAFLRAPLPTAVDGALRAAIATLLPGGPLVVRPSVIPDVPGVGCTVLGVGDVEGAMRAIRRCWAALWSATGAADPGDAGAGTPEMAVIVQRQVAADARGFLITRDPRGDGSTMRIVVAEPGTTHGPVIHQMLRDTLALVGSRHAIPPYVEDLGRLGLRIERRFGEPQEVSWAVGDGTIWVLQSQGVTDAVAPDPHRFDTAAAVGDTFSPQGVAEMLPGVLDPLSWSINGPMLERGLRTLLRRTGAVVPPLTRPLVGRFDGRAALNLSALGEALAASGGFGTVEREYLGADAATPAGGSRPRASVGGLIRAWRERRRVEDEVAVLTTAVGCLPLLQPDPARLSSGALIAYRRELRDLAERGVAAEVAASAAATTSYRNLEALLQRWLGEAAGTIEAQRITSGGIATRSVGPRRIAVLAAVLAAVPDPALRALAAGTGASDLSHRLRGRGVDCEAIGSAVEEAARDFGSVAVYAGPTYEEDPAALWRMVAAAANAPMHPTAPPSTRAAVDRAIGSQAATRSWRAVRILTGQFIDVRRRILYRLAADAVHYLALREEAKGALLTLGGMERRAIVAAAGRLVRSGHLDTAGDVGMLEDAELDQMLVGGEPVGRLTLELRRAADTAARASGPLPAAFVGSPGEARSQPRVGVVLRGWAASPGVSTGKVRHLHSAADGDALEPGEIIVAVTTDPTWTPLFLRAGGVVLEQGGPLSHAAIVARELGLPAVLSVAGAMAGLAPGSTVTVDGTAGVVTPVTAPVLAEVGS